MGRQILAKPMKPSKDTSVILRLTRQENLLLNIKSSLLNTSKSDLLRDGAFHYWNGHNDNKWSDIIQKIYIAGNDETKAQVVDIVFEYYRRRGYPHRELTNHELIQQMEKISGSKSPLLADDHLQVNITGTVLANYFHPHMMGVRCLDRYLSPLELYNDDVRFKDAIKRWLDLGRRPNEAGIRRILRTRDGTRSVVNFKPCISLALVRLYTQKNDNCLDPCMGYGGRLCGFIAANKNLLYHGIDVDSATCIGNARLSGFFYEKYNNDIERERSWKFRFKMDMGCAEDIMPTLATESYGLIMTSPPFFCTEHYSSNPNQSYLRYAEYEEWRDKFLFVIINESYRLCKVGGYLILNLKNYRKYPLADDACWQAKNTGFQLVRTYQQRMSNSEYHRVKGKNERMYHTEPIFVWTKD